jgi:acyl-CoA synthetase (NDP forming)
LAGSYQVYQALFRQTGVIEVNSVREMFSLAKTLAWQPGCRNGLGVITNGGSCGVLLADYCQDLGIKLSNLSQATLIKINKSGKMHQAYSARNPLDLVGDALSDRYEAALGALLNQSDIYGLIVVQTLQIMTETEKNVKIIIEAKKKWPDKPILTAFLGISANDPSIKLLEENKIPNFEDLQDAALAMKSLIKK